MRTRRPISINNSLVHGICNYSCKLCGVNKANYKGPREYQPYIVTGTLIKRILKAADSGIYVRYVANSGDGEATLHPEFADRLRMFGDMLREWNSSIVPPPEISVVTNGSLLYKPETLVPFANNTVSLIVSFPTSDPESYGLIMKGDSEQGEALLSRVLPGIEKAMALRADGHLSRLYFHISPPETEIIKRDFSETINCLTEIARRNELHEIELVLFPATSNRSGLLRNSITSIEMYRDIFKHYNGQFVNEVKINMQLVVKRFFHSTGEIADLVRSFRFPCLWNANLFITADGSSICCNDQSVRNPQGNVLYDSIETLMQYKESFLPGKLCAVCNQSPQKMKGSFQAVFYSLIAGSRLWLARLQRGSHTSDSEAHESPGADDVLLKNRCGNESIDSTDKDSDCSFSDSILTSKISEMKDAFSLVYRTYLKSGLQKENQSSMRVGFYNLLPSSYLLIVKRDGKVCGTLTLIREINKRLPIDELFSEEVGRIRKAGSTVCEFSALAVDTTLSNGDHLGILMSLFRKAIILGSDLFGCTDLCIMIHPRHRTFYQRKFFFESIGNLLPLEKVNGAPAVPLRLNLVTAREQVRKNDPQLYHYFYEKSHNSIKQQTIRELNDRRNLYNAEFLNELMRIKPDLLENLTEEEKRIIAGYYPGLKRDLP
jgi:wyosine [tRNA(Phe)-imidazoG37] synthetase (radical SAM superfamily)